jgi:hypothetical protein
MYFADNLIDRYVAELSRPSISFGSAAPARVEETDGRSRRDRGARRAFNGSLPSLNGRHQFMPIAEVLEDWS